VSTGTGLLVLGHQGGWDEILLVAGPIVLLAVLLWRANRKASRAGPDAPDDPAGPPPATPPPSL
jgi:hypothetical protein